jgi:hypothetical protein
MPYETATCLDLYKEFLDQMTAQMRLSTIAYDENPDRLEFLGERHSATVLQGEFDLPMRRRRPNHHPHHYSSAADYSHEDTS